MNNPNYVGLLIRDEIREKKVTNGYVIDFVTNVGLKMTVGSFSSKIYGVRQRFTEPEIDAINLGWGTDFKFKKAV